MYRNRLATLNDSLGIIKLYYEVYGGTYPDPTMRNFEILYKFLQEENNYWFITTDESEVVGSVVYKFDPNARVAKVYAAVIDSKHQGEGLIKDLMSFGLEYINEKTNNAPEVVYATTRTVHEKAQYLTEALGYKKLGILPNVHKTSAYETHCLTALFTEQAFARRHSDFKIHCSLWELANMVMQEVGLPILKSTTMVTSSKVFSPCPELEIITAQNFVKHRYAHMKEKKELQLSFFPFHEANLLLTSADQSIELFFAYTNVDGHTNFLGGKFPAGICFTSLLSVACDLLRANGSRYIELLVKAHQPKILDSILRAKFIPSAYIPAFQFENGKRYDYVLMSRPFEIFDFNDIKLTGLNNLFMKLYLKTWRQVALSPVVN